LGTELGLWVSVDGGKQWAHYKGGDLPAVAVRDLAIHPRDNDLVIGTHGRGIWIVDDITPLRALTPEVLASPVAFLPGRPTTQRLQAGGPRVLPGTDTIKLTKDTAMYTTQLVLVPDPRATHTQVERQAALDLALKIKGTLGDMTFAVERMNSVRQALDDRATKLSANDALTRRLRGASGVVDSLRKKIVATKEGGMITGEERLRENLTDLYGNIVFYDGGPSQT